MKVGVIGGGVIGLTSGIVLAEAGHDVEILTRDPFEKMTSYAAAAICYPYGVEQSARVMKWFHQTYNVIENVRSLPEVGIYPAKWRKLSRADRFEYPFWFHDIHGARELKKGDPLLPEGFESGISADLLVMGVDVYFPWLQRRFEKAGGRITLEEVLSFEDISGKYNVLINASGIGARQLCHDDGVYPARGQSVIVKNPGVQFHTVLNEEMFYLYPRGDQCLIGGSFDVDAWDLTPDDVLTRKILARAAEMEPLLKEPEVINVRVGLRPMRDTVRLESEIFPDDTPIVHNYGHGGAGYTLSWGCAFDVLEIVQKL